MNLKSLRQEKGLTQMQLAVLAGISQGKICEYEQGKVIPRIDTVISLAKALGCSLDTLFFDEKEAG